MATLSLNIIAENFNKLKSDLENISIGAKGDKTSNGGGGGASALGIGAAVAVLGQILQSTESVVGLLKIIGALVNQLVAPFVPILIGLIKPVFVLLQIFLTKILKTLGGGDTVGGALGSIEKVVKLILAAFAGIVAVIAASTAGLGALLTGAIVVITGVLALFAVDLGKALVLAIANISGKILPAIANGLANVITFIDNALGTNFAGAIINIADGILNVFVGLKDMFMGLVQFDFSRVLDGLVKVLTGIWQQIQGIFMIGLNLIKGVLVGLWEGLKAVFNFVVDGIRGAVNSFIGLFIKGLNGLIGLLNKIPGVSIGRVGGAEPLAAPQRTNNTVVNFTVQGSADEKTAKLAAELFRQQVNRRGAF